jgi:hypothetical protein
MQKTGLPVPFAEAKKKIMEEFDEHRDRYLGKQRQYLERFRCGLFWLFCPL